LSETRKNLSGLGFNFSGDADAAVSPESSASVELQGRKVALIGLSMVYHDFDLDRAKKLVREAKDGSDLVKVNIHWGTEYQHQFSRHQQTVGRALIDSGADIIIGHHPHVVQGLEIYQGKPIFYSLGNFIFDQYFSPDTQQGLAVGLGLKDGKISMALFPLQAKRAALYPMEEKDKSGFLRYFEKWSSLDGRVEIGSDGRIEESGN
jgi:poly-gamma-glutamate synthesis protein (capsule biosynthesis protein)